MDHFVPLVTRHLTQRGLDPDPVRDASGKEAPKGHDAHK